MQENQQSQKKELRGLYRHVNISVKALDAIIIGCILVIVVLTALDLQNPGFTIVFDSKGGTDVQACNQMYGELLEEPEPPTREGYIFSGWYKDPACFEQWDMDNDTVRSDMVLYAGWEIIR